MEVADRLLSPPPDRGVSEDDVSPPIPPANMVIADVALPNPLPFLHPYSPLNDEGESSREKRKITTTQVLNPPSKVPRMTFFLKKVIINYGKSNSVHVRVANTLEYAETTSKSLKI